MGGPEHASSTQDRLAGFMAELSGRSGIEVSNSFASASSFDARRPEMLRLPRDRPAQACFGSDDVLPIGALAAIRDSGLTCPGDVGILGLNDMETAGWANINLTTIQQPIDQIVRSSIELMVASLEQPDRPPEARILSCSVVERGTLRPAPVR